MNNVDRIFEIYDFGLKNGPESLMMAVFSPSLDAFEEIMEVAEKSTNGV